MVFAPLLVPAGWFLGGCGESIADESLARFHAVLVFFTVVSTRIPLPLDEEGEIRRRGGTTTPAGDVGMQA